MKKAKKDGVALNLMIDRAISERLTKYAEEKGQTKTKAVERLITMALDQEEYNKRK